MLENGQCYAQALKRGITTPHDNKKLVACSDTKKLLVKFIKHEQKLLPKT